MDSEQVEQEQGGVLTEQVRSSVAGAKLAPLDGATARLATHYAELIDNAAPSRSYATAIRVIGSFIDEQSGVFRAGSPEERELLTAWDKVVTALAEHSVASDLGPKLLAALQQLGLTPAARSKVSGALPEQAAPERDSKAAVLQLLRGESAERNANAS